MRLIGMLDSPYVRRVAISLKCMKLDFDHEPLSVFSSYEAFSVVNPVVKAPTLVTDQGIVLTDSTLILAHAERLVAPKLRLVPADLTSHALSQRAGRLKNSINPGSTDYRNTRCSLPNTRARNRKHRSSLV